MFFQLLTFVYFALFAAGQSTSTPKIRGVNLGSLFVFEPWIAYDTWYRMGCTPAKSESDCVKKLGQIKADRAFQNHWRTFITEGDIKEIASHNLNTVRIPLGFWIIESLIRPGETFPRGGLDQLRKVVGWCQKAGIQVVLDLHGAPGAQTDNNPFTGVYTANPEFYQEDNYERAIRWGEEMTHLIHTDSSFSSVIALEALNEPLQGSPAVNDLTKSYYPDFLAAVRRVEQEVGAKNGVEVVFMDKAWAAGDPSEFLPPNANNVGFDDHSYLKWSKVDPTRDAYLQFACQNNIAEKNDNEGPVFVGEFSISPADPFGYEFMLERTGADEFYRKFFAAQATLFTKHSRGWIFWTWKTEMKDNYRWDMKAAIDQGIIPSDTSKVVNPCS